MNNCILNKSFSQDKCEKIKDKLQIINIDNHKDIIYIDNEKTGYNPLVYNKTNKVLKNKFKQTFIQIEGNWYFYISH
ncbi:MAG: hypothetical protein N4A38_05020 [Candidatus Gracilibacteria bacterium]|nr:hypothetical protein [Candidatus Gracilibacteria bacterium]